MCRCLLVKVVFVLFLFFLSSTILLVNKDLHDRFLDMTISSCVKTRKKKNQYQRLLMKASDRDRNVKVKKTVFLVVLHVLY